jgi:hypothetical protein
MIVAMQPAKIIFVFVSIIALQLVRESYILLSSDTTMLVKHVQPLKAHPPISVTDLGMTIPFRLVQPSKAFPPISVTESGITILARLVQPLKAEVSIFVAESGMMILVRLVQP